MTENRGIPQDIAKAAAKLFDSAHRMPRNLDIELKPDGTTIVNYHHLTVGESLCETLPPLGAPKQSTKE